MKMSGFTAKWVALALREAGTGGAATDLTRADLRRATLIGADLGPVQPLWRRSVVGPSDWRHSCRGRSCRGSIGRRGLDFAQFTGAILIGARFLGQAGRSRATLDGVDLRGMILRSTLSRKRPKHIRRRFAPEMA